MSFRARLPRPSTVAFNRPVTASWTVRDITMTIVLGFVVKGACHRSAVASPMGAEADATNIAGR